MATATAKKKATPPTAKEDKVKVVSPQGICSYPHLATPDTKNDESDGKYKLDLLIPKARWKEEAKAIRQAVLKCGRDFYRDQSLELKDFKTPFTDVTNDEKYSEIERTQNCIRIRVKSQFKPIVVDAAKKPLTDVQIAQIKGGDIVRFVCTPFGYTQKGGGVALGLTVVQFIQAGEQLGSGSAAALEELDEIEIEAEDIDTDDDDIEDEDDAEEEEAKPAPKKAAKAKPAPKKAAPAPEEDEEEEEADEPEEEDFDEDEEEEKPAAKKTAAKKPAAKKAAPAPAKKGKAKAAPAEEEEEADDDFSFDEE